MDEHIKAKDQYSSSMSGGRITTSLWDGDNLFPPIQGIQEENQQDFLTWFLARPGGADIEIVVSHSGVGMVVALTASFTDGGRRYVRFRSDENPLDPFSGDDEEKLALIFKGEDGNYYLGSDEWKIVGAFAETVKR
jgi:hypothetical protein